MMPKEAPESKYGSGFKAIEYHGSDTDPVYFTSFDTEFKPVPYWFQFKIPVRI